MLYLFLSCSAVEAMIMNKLNIDAEAEFKISHFDRTPEPVLASTGNNFSHQYKVYLDGYLLKRGVLNSSFGVLFPDKYRPNDIDFENQVRFDYGKWFRLETLKKQEIDEDIFFSTTTTDPQSPIHTETSNYDARFALGAHSFINYNSKTVERKDVLSGTIIGEKTESQRIRFASDLGSLTLNGEYRIQDFKDQLGTRGDIDSEDINFEMFYFPKDSFSILGFFDQSMDRDLENNTELKSKEYHIESSLKLLKEIKIRNRWRLIEDLDTKTGEDISNNSNEIILNFDPHKKIGFEMSYKYEDEDKKKNVSEDINSTINEEKFKLRLVPISKINLQSGYEISEKSSSSSVENTKDTKLYSNLAFQPFKSLRMSADFSNIKRKNTFTSLVESDTSSKAVSLQYRPKQKISMFLRLDTTKTDNPSTGSFTQTDMVGSNLNADLTSFLNMVLRSSAQETSGSSVSAGSQRFLNSLELNVDILKNLKVSTEYEIIEASGINASDENLFDFSIFYYLKKFDFSLRYQQREVTGSTPIDRMTLLSNLKYQFNRTTILSLRFSSVDYVDNLTPANSYDSKTFESFLSMRF